MASETRNGMIELEKTVSFNAAGQRLDQAAHDLFPDFSRARLQKWIREGAITVDGQAVKPSQRLAGGERLRLEARPEPDGTVEPQNIALDIVLEDEHLLVLNKPSGLVVHPAAGHPDGTLQNALLYHDPGLDSVPRAGIVHRLDKDTSGVMVVARTLKAHASLVGQLQSRSMSRIYETVVHGESPASGTVNAPVGRHPHDRKRMAVTDKGKPAVSHFRVLGRFEHFSHLEVALESGRTHQIRVHMQHISLPLVGDPTYGRKLHAPATMDSEVAATIRDFPRQALHARTLRLTHPDSGREQSFDAPLPEDLAGLLVILAESDPS